MTPQTVAALPDVEHPCELLSPVSRATMQDLREDALDAFLKKARRAEPKLRDLPRDELFHTLNLKAEDRPPLLAMLLFGIWPQAYFPCLHVCATAFPGREVGELGFAGERFTDTERIEGTIEEMLFRAMGFVGRNTRRATIFDDRGRRTDRYEFPAVAVRAALLTALAHRDYGFRGERLPIDLQIFCDRLVVRCPGGPVRGLVRNPMLLKTLAWLGATDAQADGEEVIRRSLAAAGMP